MVKYRKDKGDSQIIKFACKLFLIIMVKSWFYNMITLLAMNFGYN